MPFITLAIVKNIKSVILLREKEAVTPRDRFDLIKGGEVIGDNKVTADPKE